MDGVMKSQPVPEGAKPLRVKLAKDLRNREARVLRLAQIRLMAVVFAGDSDQSGEDDEDHDPESDFGEGEDNDDELDED